MCLFVSCQFDYQLLLQFCLSLLIIFAKAFLFDLLFQRVSYTRATLAKLCEGYVLSADVAWWARQAIEHAQDVPCW